MATAVASCAAPAMAGVVLTGDYLKIGINAGGSLIDFDSTPYVGIKYDPTGAGNFSSSNDFITPGDPFAFYSIGVNGVSAVAGKGSSYNTFSATTVDASAGGPMAVSTGSFQNISFKQIISFDVDSKIVHTSVIFTNKSGGALTNVVYGVGFDPDQDVSFGGGYATYNSFGVSDSGANASVSAFGVKSGYTIALNNTTGWDSVKASISSGWQTNPYTLSSTAFGAASTSDSTIALGFDLGNFAVGQQKTVGYDYVISSLAPLTPSGPGTLLPEPGTYTMLLAGLGLMGFMVRRRKSS